MKVDAHVPVIGASFARDVDELVREKNMGYLDAVIRWCEDNNVEAETGGELVKKSPAIKRAIREEAERLNCLKRKR